MSLKEEAKEIFYRHLRGRGQKVTAQRDFILSSFLKNPNHVSTEELYAVVKKDDKSIGYATVARTVKILKEAGVAREVDFGDGRKRFEPLSGTKHHDHMICLKCHNQVEFANDQIEKLQEDLAKKHGFEMVNHRMDIMGYCRECKSKKLSE